MAIDSYNNYSGFVKNLENFTSQLLRGDIDINSPNSTDSIHAYLNGANSNAVSKHIDSKFRKANGVFFTCELLAEIVASRIKNELASGYSVLDPTCGSG